MTQRERLLAVFRGERPDAVPLFADLSHWHAAATGSVFTPIKTADTRFDPGLFDLHRELGIGVYLTGSSLWRVRYQGDVREDISVKAGVYRHVIETPLGRLVEERVWSPVSFSYDITRRMVGGMEDLAALRYAYERRRVEPCYEGFADYDRLFGDMGVVAATVGYSGLGFLMSRYMGVAPTVYALADHPAEMERTIEVINEARFKEVEAAVDSPAALVMFSDNLSSDLHTPPLFRRFMQPFYTAMADLCHRRGKWLSVHLDGRMRGLLGCLRECGVDCVDAVTPAPDGDLTPRQVRDEAGPDMILFGGIPASVWQEGVSDQTFEAWVRDYLDLRRVSPRMVLGPGDQVVPGTPIRRLRMVRELAERHGRFD